MDYGTTVARASGASPASPHLITYPLYFILNITYPLYFILNMTHFTIEELERSSTAARLGIDNKAPAEARECMAALIDNVLDPLREAWGEPLLVNSGYRCPRLNTAVGGAQASQHLLGQAADITAGGKEANRRLFNLALSLGLPFDQLIDEHRYSWLHISHRHQTPNRNQIIHL